jgi:cystathionine beta-lyase
VCGAQGTSAGLFSVMLDAHYTQDQVDAFCNALQLFRLGYSWGGPVSLVVPYALETMRSGWPAHLERGTLVRFSTGLESAQALVEDLAQSLSKNLPAC